MHYGERLRQIREKGRLSQSTVGEWEEIGKQAISNREKKDNPVVGLEYIGRLLDETNIDARFLFGQIESIELADLSVSDAPQTMSEMLKEFKKMKTEHGKNGSFMERLEADPELKEACKFLLKNRSNLQRIMGYIEGLNEGQKGEKNQEDSA